MLVATSDWLYMTLRRLKRDAEARAGAGSDQGADGRARKRRLPRAAADVAALRTPDSVLNLNTADDVQIATQGYGVGNWYLVNGDRAKARTSSTAFLPGGRGRRSASSPPKRIPSRGF